MSNLKVTTVQADTWTLPSGVEAIPCRALANISLVASGKSILNAKNVSSIIDNGPGDVTINFSTPMPSDQYVAIGMSADVTRGSGSTKYLLTSASTYPAVKTSGAVRLSFGWDTSLMSVVVFQ